jgi:hypothetical protein
MADAPGLITNPPPAQFDLLLFTVDLCFLMTLDLDIIVYQFV